MPPALLPSSIPAVHSQLDEVGVVGVETETRVDLCPPHGSCVVPGSQIQLAECFTWSTWCVCVRACVRACVCVCVCVSEENSTLTLSCCLLTTHCIQSGPSVGVLCYGALAPHVVLL